MSADAINLSAARVHAVPETLREFASRVVGTLAAVRRLDPAFGGLRVLHRDEYRVVDADFGNLESQIIAAVTARGRPSDYVDAAADGTPLPHTRSVIGFGVSVLAQAQDASAHEKDEAAILLEFRGASVSLSATSQARIELPLRAPWTDPARLRAVLAALIDAGNANAGWVLRGSFDIRMREQSPERAGAFWMMYVARPSVTACLPPFVTREPFARGELIVLSPHPPDPDNPADIEAATRLRAALGEFGLLEWATYVIHGWPPDAEEQRYEQAISGAPPDRKYMVNCVDFDGYDPERKVLLYAKLFRGLRVTPRAWGLRGIDGAVLNEARRQVRAAAKAGGVPIEWHIGLEEPARRAAELLSDYGGIPTSQIQVFHTPFENILPPHQPATSHT
jgi:hypothetical protein